MLYDSTPPWDKWDCLCESTHLRIQISHCSSSHGKGRTFHGSPLSVVRVLISHCLSYPTVSRDRWDCPQKSTDTVEGPPYYQCLSYNTIAWGRRDCSCESSMDVNWTGRTIPTVQRNLMANFDMRNRVSIQLIVQ